MYTYSMPLYELGSGEVCHLKRHSNHMRIRMVAVRSYTCTVYANSGTVSYKIITGHITCPKVHTDSQPAGRR